MTQAHFPQQDLFLAADAALREVVDQLTDDQLALAAPATWSSQPDPTVRSILAAHARDEAWVPDVIAGRTIDEVGASYDGDLLGADPIGNYDGLNDAARVIVSTELDPNAVAHLSYGDFPLSVYFEHVSYYRGFQAWSLAHLVGIPFEMSEQLVEGLWQSIEPQLDQLRAIHVFGPPVEVASGSSRETQLLGITGFWVP